MTVRRLPDGPNPGGKAIGAQVSFARISSLTIMPRSLK
jgi:hypothetical protein